MNDTSHLVYQWLSGGKEGFSAEVELVEARKKLRRESRIWLNQHNVIGFGIGRKRVQGSMTHFPCLQVFVRKKLAVRAAADALVPSVLRLPHNGEVVYTDVVEREPGRTLGVRYAGEGIRQDKISLGPGSIGVFVEPAENVSGLKYALTCWHVASNGAAQRTHVDWCDDPRGFLPNIPFGKLDRSLSRSRSDSSGRVRDVALVELNSDVQGSNRGRVINGIQGVRNTPPKIGEALSLFGFGSKQQRTGYVMNPAAMQQITYNDGVTVQFRDVVLTNAMSSPGDSGSVAVDADGRGVGVLVGGRGGSSTGESGWSAFVPLCDVLDYFSVRVSNLAAEAMVTPSSMHPKIVDTLARTIWGEAEGEPETGKIAVANVICNRLHASLDGRGKYGSSVIDVCMKNNGTVWQFSCWNPSESRRNNMEKVNTSSTSFRVSLEIARRAVLDELEDITSGSLHFHKINVNPPWAAGHQPVLVVGKHKFFNDIV